jgi:valine--pyruvate aminotransferase
MNLSNFGEKFSATSGIYEVMEDLGQALARGGEISMMGGGNPAHIPAVEAVWKRRLQELMSEPGAIERMLGDYDTPRGRLSFLEALARFFNAVFGWSIDADNLAVTVGSQTANFLLFNLMGGQSGKNGTIRKIHFPLVPEYIGYADQGIWAGMFSAWKPDIEHLGPHRFKYRLRFDQLDPEVSMLCLSRPTNPSANLVTDAEIARLSELAAEKGLHLLIDNAYGHPFPNILFRPVEMIWNEQIIHTFSLSKLGLPGTRTGIVVASKQIIRRIGVMNGGLVLAPGSLGQAILEPLLSSGELLELCRSQVLPFYQKRSQHALEMVQELFDDRIDYHVHASEGALFLWFWFRDLPITDRELYERLKARNVLVVPGSYFFPGYHEPWRHKQECIRMSYCGEEKGLRRGLGILAEELRKLY